MHWRRPALSLFALALSPLAARAEAPVPMMVTHTGRLLDANDRPAAGAHTLKFALYDAFVRDPTSPRAPLWQDSYQVTVGTDGVYQLVLGDTGTSVNHTPLVLDGAGTNLFLAVEVDGSGELSPRLRMGSAPFAFVAARAQVAQDVACNGCIDTAKLKAGAVTGEKLADATIELGKLKTQNGHMAGLDADLLDGLDSSAFAPAAIEGDVSAIKASVGTSVGSDAAAIKQTVTASAADLAAVKQLATQNATDVGTIKQTATTTASDVSAIKQTATTTGSDVSAIKASVGTSVGSDVTAVKTSLTDAQSGVLAKIAALDAKLDKLLARQLYSDTCDDFAAKGWAARADCLHDGRWHRIFDRTDTAKNGVANRVELKDLIEAGATVTVVNDRNAFSTASPAGRANPVQLSCTHISYGEGRWGPQMNGNLNDRNAGHVYCIAALAQHPGPHAQAYLTQGQAAYMTSVAVGTDGSMRAVQAQGNANWYDETWPEYPDTKSRWYVKF